MGLVILCAGGQGEEPFFPMHIKYPKSIFYFHIYLNYIFELWQGHSHKNKAKKINKGRKSERERERARERGDKDGKKGRIVI